MLAAKDLGRRFPSPRRSALDVPVSLAYCVSKKTDKRGVTSDATISLHEGCSTFLDGIIQLATAVVSVNFFATRLHSSISDSVALRTVQPATPTFTAGPCMQASGSRTS